MAAFGIPKIRGVHTCPRASNSPRFLPARNCPDNTQVDPRCAAIVITGVAVGGQCLAIRCLGAKVDRHGGLDFRCARTQFVVKAPLTNIEFMTEPSISPTCDRLPRPHQPHTWG